MLPPLLTFRKLDATSNLVFRCLFPAVILAGVLDEECPWKMRTIVRSWGQLSPGEQGFLDRSESCFRTEPLEISSVVPVASTLQN